MKNSNELGAVIADWEYLGATDPFWAVLTDPQKAGGKWDPDTFFNAGRDEIRTVMQWLESKGIKPTTPGQAVDFGCGVGRLTKALAEHFGKCKGLDASDSMLNAARRIHASDDRLEFLLNTTATIEGVRDASADFVYSNIVLQHIPPPYNRGYISELLRMTRPGGLTVFQVPVGRWKHSLFSAQLWQSSWQNVRVSLAIRTRLKRVLLRHEAAKGQMQMNCISEQEIRALVHQAGRQVLLAAYSNACDPAFNGRVVLSDTAIDSGGFLSRVFVVGTPNESAA